MRAVADARRALRAEFALTLTLSGGRGEPRVNLMPQIPPTLSRRAACLAGTASSAGGFKPQCVAFTRAWKPKTCCRN